MHMYSFIGDLLVLLTSIRAEPEILAIDVTIQLYEFVRNYGEMGKKNQ